MKQINYVCFRGQGPIITDIRPFAELCSKIRVRASHHGQAMLLGQSSAAERSRIRVRASRHGQAMLPGRSAEGISEDKRRDPRFIMSRFWKVNDGHTSETFRSSHMDTLRKTTEVIKQNFPSWRHVVITCDRSFSMVASP